MIIMKLHTMLDIISFIALVASFCYFMQGIVISGLVALYVTCMLVGAACNMRGAECGEVV